MRNFLTFQCLFLLSFSLAFSQNQSSTFIYFDHDSDLLTSESKEVLQEFVANTDDNHYVEFSIIGHTDQDGSKTYNQELSKSRAHTVRSFLNQKGIDSDLMYLDSKGEEELLYADYSDASKTKNRRVEIIRHSYDLTDTDDMLEATHKVPEQEYQIPCNQANTLIADNGTVVDIPAAAFEYADGSGEVTEEIIVTIKEAFSISDFVTEDLFTRSKDALLETGGMLYLDASAGDKQVKLKEGMEIAIQYPLQEVKPGMELFYGEEDATGTLDWTPTQERINPIDPTVFNEREDIDLQKILDYDFGKVEKPFLAEPEIPYKPRKERMPHPPVKPKGAFPHEYVKYEQKYKNYEIALEEYYKNIPIIEAKLEKWEREVTRRISLVNTFKNDMESFLGKVQAIVAIRKLEKLDGKLTKEAIASFLQNSMSANINYKFDEKELYRKVLGQYTGEILMDRDILYKRQGISELKVRNALTKEFNNLLNEYRMKAIEENFENTGELGETAFSNYVTKISRLGWINCDRFLRYPQEYLTEFAFEGTDENAKYYLIFENLRSVLRPKQNNGKLNFGKIPLNETVNLIAVKLEDNKPQLATYSCKVSHDNDINLVFHTSTLQEIKAELNAMDSRSE